VLSRTSTVASVLLEAALVVLAAAVFALAANELSPRGLKLARNYFPAGSNQSAPLPKPKPLRPPPAVAATNAAPAADETDQRLKGKGLQPIHRAEAERLFHDPRYPQGLLVFVDARDEDHFHEGHIPGAYELDPYYPEKQLGNVFPPCQAADQVIIYCNGGDCDDADSAAILLRDSGVAANKLFVYGGGYTEWTDNHLPVERGERNSGDITGQSK
jgi:rhodanese-related sulfurtransferase